MPSRRPGSSTLKQAAYARHIMSGTASSRAEAARLAGYSPQTAANASVKIERSEGYTNAMLALASKSGNVLMKTLLEFEKRDISKLTTDELLSSITVVTSAWSKIDTQTKLSASKDPEKNPLRAVFMSRSEVKDAEVITKGEVVEEKNPELKKGKAKLVREIAARDLDVKAIEDLDI